MEKYEIYMIGENDKPIILETDLLPHQLCSEFTDRDFWDINGTMINRKYIYKIIHK